MTDPSKCRETLGYELYRAAGVPAPRTTLAEVTLTVPGKYDGGTSASTRWSKMDKPFLKEHFGADAGLLDEARTAARADHLGDDWDKYKTLYPPKRSATADETKRLIGFAIWCTERTTKPSAGRSAPTWT